MDDDVSTFPLLRLPKKAILNTFRIMNSVQIFGMSLLSKKTKNLVGSLKIKARDFKTRVNDRFEIELFFNNRSRLHFKLYRVKRNKPLQEIGTPEIIRVFCERRRKWTNSMSVKELLGHLKFIFHSFITEFDIGPKCERFSLESIHKNVKDIERICFSSGNHEHNRRIMSLLQPAIVLLKIKALVNLCIPRDILIQNFNVIHAPEVQVSLDELLMTNSRLIALDGLQLSAKMVNQFLKLWIKGSNPRLDYLCLGFHNNFENETLLRGLKHTAAPHNRVRLLKAPGQKIPIEVIGGWDIWRFNGTQATVTVERFSVNGYFELCVWNDHCIEG